MYNSEHCNPLSRSHVSTVPSVHFPEQASKPGKQYYIQDIHDSDKSYNSSVLLNKYEGNFEQGATENK